MTQQANILPYESSLYKGLNVFLNFCVGLADVAVLTSISITFGFGLIAGGPILLIWGFVFAFVMSFISILSLAEICGAFPNAGGPYNWAGQLSPPRDAPIWSYVTGMANFIGNYAGDCSFANGLATFTSSALVVSGYGEISVGMQVLLSICSLIVWTLLNCIRIDQVGWIAALAGVVHIGTLLLFIILVFSNVNNLNSPEFVFTYYYNDTGFESVFYVCLLSVVTGMFAFVGYEGSAHLAEESGDPVTEPAMAMIYTVIFSGIIGLLYIITLLFATFDIDAIVNGSDAVNTGNAITNIFVLSCGEKWGEVLSWALVVNIFFGGISSVTITNRTTFALARDKAFPFSEILEQVEPHTQSPVYALMFGMILSAITNLLPLSSEGSVAFYSIVGLSTVGFQISYAIPILLKLVYDPVDFPITPMTLGMYSLPLAFISCVWLFGSSLLFFLPTSNPVTVDNMNWLFLVFIIVIIILVINWVFNSQYHFKGPKRYDEESNGDGKRLLVSTLDTSSSKPFHAD